MAHIVIHSTETNIEKVVFRNMTLDTANTIADHMNTLALQAAKKVGDTVKLIFKVIS